MFINCAQPAPSTHDYLRVTELLAILTPTRKPLALPKTYCFSSHIYSAVRLLAYYFRHLVYVF